MADARFEEGVEEPLRLIAVSGDDLTVMSALLQDAVVQASDVAWMKRRRRFAALVNRFRWEDREDAERRGRPYERVRATLMICGVLGVAANGIDPADRSLVLSILALRFEEGEEGAGSIYITFAGDGEIRIDVECLDVTLTDVTRPYRAPSGHVPTHPPD
ncbi:MAG: DUF2948 family protein [Paracoccaceae bacterium]